MSLKHEFLERRERERRADHACAVAYHYAQCERRERERREQDSAAIAQWLTAFDAAREVTSNKH